MAKAELVMDKGGTPDEMHYLTDRSQKLWKVGDHYVVTSTSVVLGEPETYVFPADVTGRITDWGELEGSFKGALDHQKAIDGYVADREAV